MTGRPCALSSFEEALYLFLVLRLRRYTLLCVTSLCYLLTTSLSGLYHKQVVAVVSGEHTHVGVSLSSLQRAIPLTNYVLSATILLDLMFRHSFLFLVFPLILLTVLRYCLFRGGKHLLNIYEFRCFDLSVQLVRRSWRRKRLLILLRPLTPSFLCVYSLSRLLFL